MQLVPFEFDGRSIRVITDAQGEEWFVGKDVCQALGYTDHANTLKQDCKGVAKRHLLQTAGGGHVALHSENWRR